MESKPRCRTDERLGDALEALLRAGALQEGLEAGLTPEGGLELSEFDPEDLALIFRYAEIPAEESAAMVDEYRRHGGRL